MKNRICPIPGVLVFWAFLLDGKAVGFRELFTPE